MEGTADIPIGAVRVKSVHPKKFALWLFMVSVSILFVAFSSAYIVKKSEGTYAEFDIPPMFLWTSVIIIISSVTIHLAYLAAKKNNLLVLRLALVVTGILAVLFTVGQFLAGGQLIAMGAHFVGDPIGSFIYVFSGMHILHLAGGLIFLVAVLINSFKYKVHSKSLTQIEMCITYWHFLGGLWLYLYLFLILNN